MTLFAFDVTFRSGKMITLFFYESSVQAALLRAPIEANRQYGDRAFGITDIRLSSRWDWLPKTKS